MDRKKEYIVRRRAAQDIHAEMKAAGKRREARKARLLMDSLGTFYADVAGKRGTSLVGGTDVYTREDYDRAHAEIMEYLKGGPMPWVRRRASRKKREEAERLSRLQLTLGEQIEKGPLAVERRMDLTQKRDRREVRRQLRLWREWGMITAFIHTRAGRVFKFEGRMALAGGRYMLRSAQGRHLPIEDLLLEPEKIEPPVVELCLIFEKRGGKGPWGGHVR